MYPPKTLQIRPQFQPSSLNELCFIILFFSFKTLYLPSYTDTWLQKANDFFFFFLAWLCWKTKGIALSITFFTANNMSWRLFRTQMNRAASFILKKLLYNILLWAYP